MSAIIEFQFRTGRPATGETNYVTRVHLGVTVPVKPKPESTDELALVECRNEESAL